MASNRSHCTTFTNRLEETNRQLDDNITALDTTIDALRGNITIQNSIKNRPDAALDGCMSRTDTLVSAISALRTTQDGVQNTQREKVNEETTRQIFDMILGFPS